MLAHTPSSSATHRSTSLLGADAAIARLALEPPVLEFFAHELLHRALGDGIPSEPPHAVSVSLASITSTTVGDVTINTRATRVHPRG